MVYTSATLSLAVLELLANLSKDQAPDDLVTVPADLPDDLPVRALEPAALPRDWRSYPAPRALAELGSRWLEKAETAVLAVPSAIIPGERNWLLNPAHPDFRRIRAGRAEPFRFDPRLWR